MENKEKTKLQYALANHSLKQSHNTFILPTGTSKTRIGVIILKHLVDNYYLPDKIPIITPTQSIKDTWIEEIIKWSGEKYLDYVRIECIQAIYQERGSNYQFVIADEIHNYMPNFDDYTSQAREYVKFFTENNIEKMLGLSAYMPPKKRKTCADVCPITFEMTVDEAVEKGFISNFTIYNVPVKLNEEQQKAYNSIEKDIDDTSEKLGGSWGAYSYAQGIIKEFAGKNISALSDDKKVLFGRAVKYMRLINERKTFLYTSSSKLNACNQIINSYTDKAIVFSASKEFADLFASTRDDTAIMHSGISKKKRTKYLEEFRDHASLYNVLSAVNTINEGVNVPKVKLAILVSGNATRKDLTQRLGRALRITDNDRSAIFIQLYIPDSQDEKWMKQRIEGIGNEKIVYLSSIEQLIQLL